jgi:hypothetical protein
MEIVQHPSRAQHSQQRCATLKSPSTVDSIPRLRKVCNGLSPVTGILGRMLVHAEQELHGISSPYASLWWSYKSVGR